MFKLNSKTQTLALMVVASLSSQSVLADNYFQTGSITTPTISNEFNIGYTISEKKINVDNLYSSESSPTHGLELSNSLRVKSNDTLSHNVRLRNHIEYHKDDLNMSIPTPLGTVAHTVPDAKWLQNDTNLSYSPEISIKQSKVYPIIGVGYEYTQLGSGSRKLSDNRSYMQYGLGAEGQLTPYQSVFLEGTYQKDFDTRHSTEYNKFIPKQKIKSDKGEKYTVEVGMKSQTNASHDANQVTLSAYHSVYKNQNGHQLNIPTPFGTYGHEVGKSKERETGVKIGYSFN